MSLYSDLVTRPRRQSARYYELPARRGADLSTDPRVEVYEPALARRYPDSDREQRLVPVVKSQPIRYRNVSPDDYERTSPQKALVIRPRSTSRVRIREPAFVAVDYSSSDEEPRRRRRDRADNTHIRATSRPGKKNEYAFVRKASKKGRRKSDARTAVVTDLELKTDRRHREFQSRRDDLENTEALMLVRARSRERELLVDQDVYDGRRRRSVYAGESRRKHLSVDEDRRAIVVARNDRDDRRKSTRDSKRYSLGKGVLIAGDEEDLRPRRRRVSISPDRETIDSSVLGGSVRRANTVSSRDQPIRLPRVYDDVVDPEPRRDPRRDSAYFTDNERRAKEREREAMDREKRAIDREKAALDRERLLVDREKRGPVGDVPDDVPKNAADYLKQGGTYLKDGQKYYKSGQGLINGVRGFLK